MSSESNKALVRRDFEEIWNKGNYAIMEEILSPNGIRHELGNASKVEGLAGAKQAVEMYRSAFPDLHFTLEDLIAEGEKVAVRWTARGTHKGEFNGIPATNKAIVVRGISIARISGGKVSESWISWDTLSLLQQVGAIPA